MEIRGIFLEETPQGLEGSINVEELRRFFLSLNNSPQKVFFKVFEFAHPRPGHTHGMKLKRESIAQVR